MTNYLYDANLVRYELYQTNGGGNYNWLFFPGGPGADSCYMRSLAEVLKLPGNVWLIDLPGNGGNEQEAFDDNYDQWLEIFPKVVTRFSNPVLVGHSFGGMLPLMCPEMENHLKGCVILNSVPVLWLEEAVNYSKQFDLPDFNKEMQAFIHNPNPETFNIALGACAPYYFSKENLEAGKQLLLQVPFRWQPAVWWQRKAVELQFSAKWVPQHVPTLIIGAKYDCICPFSLFKNDDRFRRQNIRFSFVENGGHMPWLENPAAVRAAFEGLYTSLDGSQEIKVVSKS